MTLIKLLQDLGIDFGGVALCVVIIMTLVQIAPIKIDPWSALFRWFGKEINGELMKKVVEIENRLDKKEKKDEERDALSARRRILVFNDEVVRKMEHTPEHWNSVLEDITFYTNYSDTHPGFKNDKATRSISNLNTTYDKLQQEHKMI